MKRTVAVCMLLLSAAAGARAQFVPARAAGEDSSRGAAANPAAQTPVRLTLAEAIARAMRDNLRVRVADARLAETAATRERRLSALLPRAQADITSALQSRNLRAFGITFPSIPGFTPPGDVVGPFATHDFRASFEQPVLDLRAWNRWRASERGEESARLSYLDTRDLIARQVTALYLAAQAADSRVRAAGARVRTADALAVLAREQRAAGVATGVDVLRAEVQLANERQRQLEARNAARQSLLDLARATAMEFSVPLELAEPLEFNEAPAPELAAAVAQAQASRADLQSLLVQREQLGLERKASRARYTPRLSVSGDYGGIGRTLGEVRGTGTIAGRVSMTIFDRDRAGEADELDARLRALDEQITDARRGIEQEVRAVLLTMESAAAEVRVSREGRTLAERELELARDRFAAGVTNNIEVTTAQDSVARALENEILALVRHADARYALARALGASPGTK